jgi:hypothetical protein
MARPTRNTPIFHAILTVLNKYIQPKGKKAARAQLERHFHDRLIVDAGDVEFVASAAEQLRLRVEKDELPLVLDYIGSKDMVGITVEHVETAINELLGENRFIEPGE